MINLPTTVLTVSVRSRLKQNLGRLQIQISSGLFGRKIERNIRIYTVSQVTLGLRRYSESSIRNILCGILLNSGYYHT